MSEDRAWRCTVCGYIHYGDEPPDECPVCGAPSSDFEPITSEQQPAAAQTSSTGKIVIAGAGIAGLSAAEAAREAASDVEIVLLSAEEELPYYRLNLTRYLAGEVDDEELPIHPSEWYEQNRINIQTGKRLRKLNPSSQNIELNDGTTVDYGNLIVATGASPFLPTFEGNDLPHVHTLRTANDAKAILAAFEEGSQVICIGGGILGLETAGALARQGGQVTVLEAFDHLMSCQLNAAGSDIMAQHLYTMGIDVITQAKVKGITSTTVEMDDGSTLPADLVVITVGVRSNLAPLTEAGLSVNHGVLVDNFMRTSNPNILAAGDVCEHDGVMYGSWAAAQYQGKIAGKNAAGVPTEFGGIPRSHTLKVLNKNMFSIGEISPTDENDTVLDEYSNGDYRMFMVHDGVLIGALLIGDLTLLQSCRKAIENSVPLGSISTAEQVVRAITAS